jgi:hypothetical protein
LLFSFEVEFEKKKQKMILILFLSLIIERALSVTFGTNCPQNFICDYDSLNKKLTLTGSTSVLGNFELPLTSSYPGLTTTESIVIEKSNGFRPTNLCDYKLTLKRYDSSRNNILLDITNSTFGCLTGLQYLNLSNNQVRSLTDNSFDTNYVLITLDLSNNLIASIPLYTFYRDKLELLNNLYLSYNRLTTIDPWFLYLKAIRTVDLSHNRIERFTNQLDWNLYNGLYYYGFSQATFDLTFNNLQEFNDETLITLRLCDSLWVNQFLQFIYKANLANNNFNCECSKSHNLLTFIESSIASNAIDTKNNVFRTSFCLTAAYSNKSVFLFETSTKCVASVTDFNQRCNPPSFTTALPTSIATTTAASNNSTTTGPIGNVQLLIDATPSSTTKINLGTFYNLSGYQKFGIAMGVVFLVFLTIVLVYCLCQTECNAILFECIPFFYKCCPCKRYDYANKQYDLFVSYNRSSEKWVIETLMPFLLTNKVINTYFLHYDSKDNADRFVYSDVIADKMGSSTCHLVVLSDSYLLKEWKNLPFQRHLRTLVMRNRTRLYFIQLHDVCDEEVDDYLRNSLQIPNVISLENDEFLFWLKLTYYLHSNRCNEEIMPLDMSPRDLIEPTRPDIDNMNIYRKPIVHLLGYRDPLASETYIPVKYPNTQQPPPQLPTTHTTTLATTNALNYVDKPKLYANYIETKEAEEFKSKVQANEKIDKKSEYNYTRANSQSKDLNIHLKSERIKSKIDRINLGFVETEEEYLNVHNVNKMTKHRIERTKLGQNKEEDDLISMQSDRFNSDLMLNKQVLVNLNQNQKTKNSIQNQYYDDEEYDDLYDLDKLKTSSKSVLINKTTVTVAADDETDI